MSPRSSRPPRTLSSRIITDPLDVTKIIQATKDFVESDHHRSSGCHQDHPGHQGLCRGINMPGHAGLDIMHQLAGVPSLHLTKEIRTADRPLSSRILDALSSSMIPFPGHIRGSHTPGDTPLKTGFITITIRVRELKLCNLPC
jgi:hypothetical protein